MAFSFYLLSSFTKSIPYWNGDKEDFVSENKSFWICCVTGDCCVNWLYTGDGDWTAHCGDACWLDFGDGFEDCGKWMVGWFDCNLLIKYLKEIVDKNVESVLQIYSFLLWKEYCLFYLLPKNAYAH